MNYFKLFDWKDFFFIIIALAPCVYFFSIADCNGKDNLAIGALIAFLWGVISTIKKVRELENKIKSLSEKKTNN